MEPTIIHPVLTMVPNITVANIPINSYLSTRLVCIVLKIPYYGSQILSA